MAEIRQRLTVRVTSPTCMSGASDGGAYACEISLLTPDTSLTSDRVREQLPIHEEIVHVTVEINRHE